MPGKIFQKGMPSIPGMPEIDLPKRITIGRDEIFSVGVTLQQPLFTGFRVLNGYKMAKEGLKATNAEYLSNKNKLIFRVEENLNSHGIGNSSLNKKIKAKVVE